ncbi:MAG: tripartite tricarboxylate transporter substrate binding protein, partial [Burkholderiaceae bacterium]
TTTKESAMIYFKKLFAVFTILSTSIAFAADPITIIWPSPAGGGGDIYFRIFSKVIEKEFGVPVVVSNISGGGGSIGVAKMVGSKPDGTTLAGAWTGPISIAPHTLGISYTPDDYIPVMLFSSAPYVICTLTNFPANTATELLYLLKKNPNKYSFVTHGPGGLAQLAATRVFLTFGITQRDIPYKGAGESRVGLLGGHVDMYVGSIPPILQFIQTGSVKCLLVTAAKRAKALPGTTSLSELGIAGEETLLWRAIFVPRGTPPDRIAYLEKILEVSHVHPRL